MLNQFFDYLQKQMCFSENIPHRVFALLSKDVYLSDDNSQSVGGWSRIFSSDSQFSGEAKGYFGAAFIQNNQIIIAHRGTEFTDSDDLNADWQLLTTQANQQYAFAMDFLNKIKSRFPNHIFFHTGHSLGAVLAETLACLNNMLAVTFDSPGSFHSIRALAPENFKIRSIEDLFQRCHITTYLTSPTVINVLDQHPGTVLHLKMNQTTIPQSEANYNFDLDPKKLFTSFVLAQMPKALIDYKKYVEQQHSIKNIADLFTSALTCPIQTSVVKQWPSQISCVMGHYQHEMEVLAGKSSPLELIKNFGFEVSAVGSFIRRDVLGEAFLIAGANALIAGASAFLLMNIINSQYSNSQKNQLAFCLLAIVSFYSATYNPWIMSMRLLTSLFVHFLGSFIKILQNSAWQIFADSAVMGLLIFTNALHSPSAAIPMQLQQWNAIAKGIGGFFGTALIEMTMPKLPKIGFTFAGKLFAQVSSRNKCNLLPMTNDDLPNFKRQ